MDLFTLPVIALYPSCLCLISLTCALLACLACVFKHVWTSLFLFWDISSLELKVVCISHLACYPKAFIYALRTNLWLELKCFSQLVKIVKSCVHCDSEQQKAHKQPSSFIPYILSIHSLISSTVTFCRVGE